MDLSVMMREQARAGLQAQLDKAVVDGDTAAAMKAADDIAKLAIATAPKALAFNNDDIKAELDKQPWFGTDPKRSAKAVEFGKTMDPKKFASAEAFATAIVKAVDEEFKAPGKAAADAEDEDDGDAGDEDDGDAEDEGGKPAVKRVRKTDSPGEGDNTQRGTGARRTGPWLKLSDAPADVQKEIRRSADKLVSSTAPKEHHEKFIARALGSHYAEHQRKRKK